MFGGIWFVLLALTFDGIASEDIRLPSFIMFNQSLSKTSPLYLCHVHQLNNVEDRFLRGYHIIDGRPTGHVHHLLIYECSLRQPLHYSGLCGKHNAEQMPKLVYDHCQTRIIIAWALGGERNYTYPMNTGLKIDRFTQLLLEVHFDPSIPDEHAIGIHLEFYQQSIVPEHEIGVLTLGTLAQSPLFLPPRLEIIHFPTYCARDCLKSFFANQSVIHVFALLVHAHRHARRITLKKNHSDRLIDRNPFEFHRQEMKFFSLPYPIIQSTDELSLICSYSTRDEHSQPIRGGYHSDEEMCQAFLYYYPKIPSFPLCLSLPIYKNLSSILNQSQIWTDQLSHSIKKRLESTREHWMLCGDHSNGNESNLRVTLYRQSIDEIKLNTFQIKRSFSSDTLLVSLVVFAMICTYLFIHKRAEIFF